MPLSQKQMEYLALAWQCFETEPKIDYAKFATVANLASANSARELMRVTKKKLKEEYGALDNGTGTSPIKKSTSTTTSTPRSTPGAKRGRASVGKKVAAEMEEDHDDDEEMRASPSKKSKTNDKTNGVVKVEKEAEESDDGDLV